MRYRLRTLMIVLAVVPLMMAWLMPPLLKIFHRQPAGLFKLNVKAAKSDYLEVTRWIQVDGRSTVNRP
jgi:hypothetical protein